MPDPHDDTKSPTVKLSKAGNSLSEADTPLEAEKPERSVDTDNADSSAPHEILSVTSPAVIAGAEIEASFVSSDVKEIDHLRSSNSNSSEPVAGQQISNETSTECPSVAGNGLQTNAHGETLPSDDTDQSNSLSIPSLSHDLPSEESAVGDNSVTGDPSAETAGAPQAADVSDLFGAPSSDVSVGFGSELGVAAAAEPSVHASPFQAVVGQSDATCSAVASKHADNSSEELVKVHAETDRKATLAAKVLGGDKVAVGPPGALAGDASGLVDGSGGDASVLFGAESGDASVLFGDSYQPHAPIHASGGGISTSSAPGDASALFGSGVGPSAAPAASDVSTLFDQAGSNGHGAEVLFGGPAPALSSFPGPADDTAALFGGPAVASFAGPADDTAALFGGPVPAAAFFGGPGDDTAALFGGPGPVPSAFSGPSDDTAALFGGPASAPTSFAGPADDTAALFSGPAPLVAAFQGPVDDAAALFGGPAPTVSAFPAAAAGASQGYPSTGVAPFSAGQTAVPGAAQRDSAQADVSSLFGGGNGHDPFAQAAWPSQPSPDTFQPPATAPSDRPAFAGAPPPAAAPAPAQDVSDLFGPPSGGDVFGAFSAPAAAPGDPRAAHAPGASGLSGAAPAESTPAAAGKPRAGDLSALWGVGLSSGAASPARNNRPSLAAAAAAAPAPASARHANSVSDLFGSPHRPSAGGFADTSFFDQLAAEQQPSPLMTREAASAGPAPPPLPVGATDAFDNPAQRDAPAVWAAAGQTGSWAQPEASWGFPTAHQSTDPDVDFWQQVAPPAEGVDPAQQGQWPESESWSQGGGWGQGAPPPAAAEHRGDSGWQADAQGGAAHFAGYPQQPQHDQQGVPYGSHQQHQPYDQQPPEQPQPQSQPQGLVFSHHSQQQQQQQQQAPERLQPERTYPSQPTDSRPQQPAQPQPVPVPAQQPHPYQHSTDPSTQWQGQSQPQPQAWQQHNLSSQGVQQPQPQQVVAMPQPQPEMHAQHPQPLPLPQSNLQHHQAMQHQPQPLPQPQPQPQQPQPQHQHQQQQQQQQPQSQQQHPQSQPQPQPSQPHQHPQPQSHQPHQPHQPQPQSGQPPQQPQPQRRHQHIEAKRPSVGDSTRTIQAAASAQGGGAAAAPLVSGPSAQAAPMPDLFGGGAGGDDPFAAQAFGFAADAGGGGVAAGAGQPSAAGAGGAEGAPFGFGEGAAGGEFDFLGGGGGGGGGGDDGAPGAGADGGGEELEQLAQIAQPPPPWTAHLDTNTGTSALSASSGGRGPPLSTLRGASA